MCHRLNNHIHTNVYLAKEFRQLNVNNHYNSISDKSHLSLVRTLEASQGDFRKWLRGEGGGGGGGCHDVLINKP